MQRQFHESIAQIKYNRLLLSTIHNKTNPLQWFAESMPTDTV